MRTTAFVCETFHYVLHAIKQIQRERNRTAAAAIAVKWVRIKPAAFRQLSNFGTHMEQHAVSKTFYFDNNKALTDVRCSCRRTSSHFCKKENV